MNVFVIGNGESRRGFDLNRLRDHGTIIGCNALYRDFTPDVLVAVDRPILKEICASGYADKHRVYVRERFYDEFKQHTGVNPLPVFWGLSPGSMKNQSFSGWSSGPSAVALATSMYNDNDLPHRIFLIGFDMIGVGDRVNNMYKGTAHYVPGDKKATFYGNWARQLLTVFQSRPEMEFIKLGGKDTTTLPGWWEDLKNVKYEHLENLEIFLKS